MPAFPPRSFTSRICSKRAAGIKNAESHFGSEPFLTYSGDILTDVELQPLIDEHFRRGNDVTLALRHTGLASAVALRDHRVVDISNRYGVAGNFDFANIAVWNSAIFQRIPPHKKISFIPIIADWIAPRRQNRRRGNGRREMVQHLVAR